MHAAQATPTWGKIEDKPHPTSSNSPFDQQGSAIESSDSNCSQSNHSSNNQPQHSPSTLELKKLEAELEERHRINTECIKQNLSMQHHRDLKIVRDEAYRRLDDALSWVRSSEEKAIAQSRQTDNLQCQLNKLSQLVMQQQQTPINIATPQHNMTKQHDFSHYPHTYSHAHQHTQDFFNLSLNSSLTGVLDKFERFMVQQNNVLHESLRQSVPSSKEHYLSNAKPCDGKTALEFSISVRRC